MTQSDTNPPSRDSTQTATQSAKELGEEARESAQNLKDRAVQEASKQGEHAKEGLAEEISDVGNALRRAAGELRDGSPQERTFGHMADALADMSDTVRDKDLGEVAGDLSDLARRNPLAFLGGAALLGFVGTRVARASERNRGRSVDLSDYWGSDADDDDLEAEIVGRRASVPAQPVSAPVAQPRPTTPDATTSTQPRPSGTGSTPPRPGGTGEPR